MKKATGIFSLLTFAALILGACAEKKSDSGKMEFEAYDYSVVTQQTDVDSTLPATAHYWHQVGSGLLPVASADNPGLTALRDTLMTLGRVKFSEKGEVQIIPSQNMQATELKPDSTECGSGSSTQLAIVLATPKVIVWECYNYEYPYMAAHGTTDYTYVNYNVSTGKILTLSDMMKKGYESALVKMIREKLRDNDNLIVSVDSIAIPANWRVAPSGLEFIWEPYEIAPYSEGVVRVLLDTGDLELLLTKEALKMLDTASF